MKTEPQVNDGKIKFEAACAMETEPIGYQLNDGEILIKKLDEDSVMETDNVLRLSIPSMMSVSPDLKSEDQHSSNEDRYLTPKNVFDPFAPGHDKLLMAPLCRKYVEKPGIKGPRRLKFISSLKLDGGEKFESDASTMSDEDLSLMETMAADLMELILSTQIDAIAVDSPVPYGLFTPTSAPRPTGIAETCPPAPVKATPEFKNIDDDKGLFKKLKF